MGMGHTLIYGGTFDPIHLGHLIVCQRAREILGGERVLLIPAWVSPHKVGREGASGADRLAMVERAIMGEAYFLADGRELERGEREGRASFTIETVESLRGENAGERFTVLIGADQLMKFHTWHRVRELVELVEIAVLGRPGSEVEEGLKVVGRELGEKVAGRMKGVGDAVD